MQIRFFAWLSQYPKIDRLTWHTPNQGRSAQEGAKLKLMGVKPGVPDIFVAIPFTSFNNEAAPDDPFIGRYAGLFLELKSKTGSLSDNQRCMFQNLEEIGYRCFTANTLEYAKEIIRTYYGEWMQ